MIPPLQFSPILKRIRWGGRRLGTVLSKSIGDASDYAESWEISDHREGQSVVVDGLFAGRTLNELVREKADELLGLHSGLTQFPLLVKFLDANDSLSVQVHPNDDRAKQYIADENGKTEAWVIVSSEPGSRLYAGLNEGVDAESLQQAIEDGTVEDCLHSIEVEAGDCVFIPAGTVHAIGAGIVLAEIQQASDLTFRLYDWGRMGTDGKPRELHISESLACTDFTRCPVNPVVPKPISGASENSVELVNCDYFVMRRHTSNQPFRLENNNRFRVLMTLGGNIEIRGEEFSTHAPFGQTTLIPASCPSVEVLPQGDAVILEAYLP